MTEKPASKKKNNVEILVVVLLAVLILLLVLLAGYIVLGKRSTPANTPIHTLPNTVPPVATATPFEIPVQNYTPVFQSAPCPFTAPDQIQVTCGFLVVPEDRSGDVTDTIQIAVAVFHSTSSSPKPDPILYLQGGPGDKAIDWSVTMFDVVVAPFLAERNFIVFDPRGVGYSQPVLDCDQFRTTYLQDIQGKIPADQKISYYEGALLGCRNTLQQAGVNLSAYTSMDMAADAKDVLIGLGYKQANLYGISYGTRIGQLVMRDHPEFVRSAILDSVVPIEVNMLEQGTSDPDEALQVLFDGCNADPSCSTAFPGLEQAYNDVFNQLNSNPVNVKLTLNQNKVIDQVVDGWTFRDTLLWSLRSPQTIAIAPSLIYRSRNGDNSILMFTLALPVLVFDSIAVGDYISVNCHDQVFAMSTNKLNNTLYDMCELWDTRPLLSGEKDPVKSEIPTLIFSGTYDPVTPPTFARQLAQNLKHSYIAEFSNEGHAPSATGSSDCPTRLMAAFLQDPNTSPDVSCLNENNAIKFVVPFSATTPMAMEPRTIGQYQVSAQLPAGWREGQFGFYDRVAWAGDTTQIGVQRAAVSENDWVVWLSSNFQGNRGFDQTAVRYDQRQAKGLTWSLYKTTLNGNTIDIAFAKSGSETLMILMVSYPDERDALYNAVFLPVIDSTTSLK